MKNRRRGVAKGPLIALLLLGLIPSLSWAGSPGGPVSSYVSLSIPGSPVSSRQLGDFSSHAGIGPVGGIGSKLPPANRGVKLWDEAMQTAVPKNGTVNGTVTGYGPYSPVSGAVMNGLRIP